MLANRTKAVFFSAYFTDMTILQKVRRQCQSHSTKQKTVYCATNLLGQGNVTGQKYDRHLNMGNRAVASFVFSRGEVLVFILWRKKLFKMFTQLPRISFLIFT